MNKRIVFLLFAVLAIYQYSNKSADSIVKPVSGSSIASSIDRACDAVVFTTATCPYCQKARTLLGKEEVEWCEFDINDSGANYSLYKVHGGNGVPHAIIGNTKLQGFNRSKYMSAIRTI
jgi:glutaredoxin